MSFVQRLRMQNMFPIKSDLGNARIPIEPDVDIESIIRSSPLPQQTSGLRRVSERMQPNPIGDGRHLLGQNVNPDLKFGGVVGEQSNPGADILARSRNNAENLWQSYKEPQITADEIMGRVGKPSRDAENYQQYLDNALKTKTVDSNIAQNERRIGNEERRLDQADKRIETQENLGDRRLDIAEGNANLKTDLANDKKAELNTTKQRIKESAKSRAQEGLELIKELMNDDGTLKPDTESATGFTGKFPMLEYTPFGFGESMATGNAKLDRLQSLLTLGVLQDLKELSKTGATGMGALNLKELGVLENAGSLLGKRGMREGSMGQELVKIKSDLEKVLQPDRYDVGGQQNTSQVPAGKIKVRRKSDGKLGYVSKLTPDYEEVQ